MRGDLQLLTNDKDLPYNLPTYYFAHLAVQHWMKVAALDFSKSLINNRMGTARIDREAFEVGFKGWNWSMGSIQDPWYTRFHLYAAQTRAKRAF